MAKKIIIGLAIYLLGSVCSYLLWKSTFFKLKMEINKNHPNDKVEEWTVGDRNVCLMAASLSWGGVFLNGISRLDISFENPKKAKW